LSNCTNFREDLEFEVCYESSLANSCEKKREKQNNEKEMKKKCEKKERTCYPN